MEGKIKLIIYLIMLTRMATASEFDLKSSKKIYKKNNPTKNHEQI